MQDIRNQKILIGTKQSDVISQIADSFEGSYTIKTVVDRNLLHKEFSLSKYDLCFIDTEFLKDKTGDYEVELGKYLKTFPSSIIIVMTDQNNIRDAVYAVKSGAADYFTYPGIPSEIRLIVDRVYEKRRRLSELAYLRNQVIDAEDDNVSKTRSNKMRSVLAKVSSVSKTNTTILLTGETGTGKSFIAGLIHRLSKRKERQFISVHCGAIPDSLIESELFGHEKGAFTGAMKRKMGQFEIAQNGTIFLDEIGTITRAVQIKLLQILQEKVFHRIGGETVINSDARIIAATNEDLSELVKAGEFRKDLYYRLNVFPIELPPLRDRKEDIEPISETILQNLNELHQKDIVGIHPEVIEAFQEYNWPGNIREMENLIERAYILEKSEVLTPNSFPGDLFQPFDLNAGNIYFNPSQKLSEVRRKAIDSIEELYLKGLLSYHRGKINKSAETAGITTRQLHKLLTKYKIQKNEYK